MEVAGRKKREKLWSRSAVQTESPRTAHYNRVFRCCPHLKFVAGEEANNKDQRVLMLLQFRSKIDIKSRRFDVNVRKRHS